MIITLMLSLGYGDVDEQTTFNKVKRFLGFSKEKTEAADSSVTDNQQPDKTTEIAPKEQKKDKSKTVKDAPCTLLDLPPDAVLGKYEDIIQKKFINITRKDVVEHLKAIGFDLSFAQPRATLKEVEMQAAAFLVVMHYILPMAKQEDIDKELAERVKFMASQLIFGRFMEKRVMERINIDQVKNDAMKEIIEKRKNQKGYDIFVAIAKSKEDALEIKQKIEAAVAAHSDTLVSDLEAIAKDAHKDIDDKTLKHPTLIAAKRTNGWLLPRQVLLQESNNGQSGKSGDLVFLIEELIQQFLGEKISDKIIKNKEKLISSESIEGHQVVVYVVNSKPFKDLSRLVEMFATEEMRRILPKKQKEAQFQIIKGLYEKNKKSMTIMDESGKEKEIPEKALQMLGYSM